MKRVFGILTAVLAMCALGVSQVSPASAYPPAAPLLTTPTPTTTVGASVTLTATGFVAGAVVTFQIGGTSQGTAVASSAGVATLVVTAPSSSGTFTVTAASPDGRTASLVLTVLAVAAEAPVPSTISAAPIPATGSAGRIIPATGSDSSSMSRTAGVLVLIGFSLVGVALLRRRSHAAAA